MGYLSVLLLLIGFYAFLNKQKHYTLIFICIISTNYFGFVESTFLLGPISLQHGDLVLVLIFSLLPFRTNTSSKELKGIQYALLLFFAFLAISVFYDYAVRGTSVMQIFRTIRKVGYLAFFFLLNSFKWKDYKKTLRFLIIVTSIHAFLYITQYIFGYSYTANLDAIKGRTHLNEYDDARYGNGPSYLIVVLVLILYSNLVKNYKITLVLLFTVAILLGQGRGAIISMVSIFLLWLFLQNKINFATLIVVPLLSFMAYLLAQNYFPILGERFNHLFDEIARVGTMDYRNLNAFYHEGSFIFRWGMTYERLMYVLEEPTRILLGVGYVPDMDVMRPIFELGTKSTGLPTGFEQYNSVDIFFPNIITRYGLLGSFIFLFFIFQLFKIGFKNKRMFWGKVLLTYLFSMLFISLVNQTFYNGRNFLMIFILVGLVLLEKRNRNWIKYEFLKKI